MHGLDRETFAGKIIYVDTANLGKGENGLIGQPYGTMVKAYSEAKSGDTVIIRAGIYPETLTLSKATTIMSQGGTATIGKTTIRVPGFLPSTSGFHFSNSFPHVPLLPINVLGEEIPIGDAANGLCGGMVFAVRDYYEAHLSTPSDKTSPSSGPLFDYLVERLFDSFNLTEIPPGPAIYMYYMNPELSDHETVASEIGITPHGRAWVMINEEWPKIKGDLDKDTLSPVGLIETKSWDPFDLGKNHQVLAYGYDLNGTNLTIHLYDPNEENNDNITLSLSIANPEHTTPVTFSTGKTVWCFFRPDYTFSWPPAP